MRETARRLGVHENTVRNWARDGLLPSAKVPGSRFHRFAVRDVERLVGQRSVKVSSVATERSTLGPELIDASQLSRWATTRDAPARFPELMRRLLAAAPGVTNVSVRAGDGISAPGWDGRAESSGAPYLPVGSLCLEFGVGSRPKQKADEDFEKRRDDSLGVDPAKSIFVFVTPRRWSEAAAWAQSRRAEDVFADVRVIDADDLEGWLQVTPAVHYWISEHLGRRPTGAETVERWWTRFQAKTEPAIPKELLLAGRADARGKVMEFLGSEPETLTLQAPWRDEAVAFIAAVFADAIERESGNALHPLLVVTASEVWDRLVREPGRVTLIPLFDNPDLATARERGHHVLLPAGGDEVVRGTHIDLPRPHRHEAGEALQSAGIPFDKAYELAALARRSMPAFVRVLARDPRLKRPPWAQPPDSAILAPLVLVGAWTPSDVDIAAVTEMTGTSWHEIERRLRPWVASEDPPIFQRAEQWHFASLEEAFEVLRHALTRDVLERWRQLVLEVLTETDPRLDLPPEDRSMAGVLGVSREHSDVLRHGVADAVAIVGSVGPERLSDGRTGMAHANRVVRELLERANDDPTGSIWRSLSNELRLLAEAAPEEFLDAVHVDLDRDEPLLATMFQDRDSGSSFYSSSPHTGLLWALEVLCWSGDYLLEAVRALARLDGIDPGGRLSNRPLGSLESILVWWIHHTSATVSARVEAIETVCRELPDVGWRLVLALWPTHHATSSPPATPAHHDWRPQSRGVPFAEGIEYIGHLVRLGLNLAADNADRWADLVGKLGALPPEHRAHLLDELNTATAEFEKLDPDERLVLWETLHKEVARHRSFREADWALDDQTLSRMDEIADRLEPRASTDRYAYLFEWRPDLPEVDIDDHASYDKRLLALRVEAIEDTIRTSGIDGLQRLADRSAAPSQLGWTIDQVDYAGIDGDLLSCLLSWLDAQEPKRREVASNWASAVLNRAGSSKLRELLGRPELMLSERRRALAVQAEATPEVWDLLASIDAELTDAYWLGMNPWRVQPEDADRATRELLARDRPWTAVDLLAAVTHREEQESSVTPQIVRDVFDAALTSESAEIENNQSLGYELGKLLDYLEAEDVDLEQLAGYEFAFFRLLEDHRAPRALFKAMSHEPGLFVDLVKRVYRGKNEQRRQLGDREEAQAHHAWWVLHGWNEVPGRRDDGTIDSEHLKRWVAEARNAFAESDRADIGDEQLGQLLAYSPTGIDGIWPAEPVREVIEAVGSTSIESGLHVGVFNSRGVTTRGPYDGGQQERDLALRYRGWAKQAAPNWRRTSRVLRGLADEYERDAQREDDRAALSADTE